MNNKTVRIADSRLNRLGGDIERLSDTFQRIESHDLDKKIGLDLLIGFAENLIEHAKVLNKPPMFNRAELTDDEHTTILQQYEAERLARHGDHSVAEEMTQEELAEYAIYLKQHTDMILEAESVEANHAEEAMNVTAARLQSYIDDNSCCVTFDIDSDLDSIVAAVKQSECSGGEVDPSEIEEARKIIAISAPIPEEGYSRQVASEYLDCLAGSVKTE